MNCRNPRITQLVVSCLLIGSTDKLMASWTQVGGDAGHSGYVDADIDASRLMLRWFSPLDYAAIPYGWDQRGVAVDGERVYRTALEGQSVNGVYYVDAFDLHDGSHLWQFTTNGYSYSGISQPVVAGGKVYVNQAGWQRFLGEDYPSSPTIFALNPLDGSELYHSTYDSQWGSGNPPTAAGEYFYAAGGFYGGLYAYNADTGSVAWRYNSDFGEWNHAADDDFFYIHNTARSPASGLAARTFIVPTSRQLDDPITDGSGQVLYNVVGSDSIGMALIDAHTGAVAWESKSASIGATHVVRAFGGGHIAMLSRYDTRNLEILNAGTGQLLRAWVNSTYLDQNDIVLTNTHAFVRDATSTFGVNLHTGRLEWSYPMSGKLAFSDGYLFISNGDGLAAFAVPEPTSLACGVFLAAIFFAMRGRSMASFES